MTTRLRNSFIISAIIVIGIALAFVAQPPPLAFADGWSSPRRLFPIDLRDSHSIVLADDQTFHLAWANTEKGVPQIFSGRLNLKGEWLNSPTRISNVGVRSLSPALTVVAGEDLIQYIEKSQPIGALMQAMARIAPSRLVEAIGDMRQLTLAGNGRIFFGAWSENREGQPAIYLARKGAFRLSPEPTLALQPTLLLLGDILHCFYFTDDNKSVDLRYRRIAWSDMQIGEALILSHRAQTGSISAYPLSIRADANGTLYVFESVGTARLTRFNTASGARIDAQSIALDRVRTNGAVDATPSSDSLWVTWSGEARRGRAPQVFVRRFALDGKPQADEVRLTFTTAGAFQPNWFMDRAGTQHLFWVENVSDTEAALFYADTAQPADVSIWQRLGFAGSSGLPNLLVTIATAFMLALVLLIVNVWRMLIVSALLLIAFRFMRVRISGMFTVFIIAELLLSAPTQEMIGQPAINLSLAAHWAFMLPALALVLLLLREWRNEMSESLRWPALTFVFSFIYYWMNALVILREAYAV